MGKILNQRTEDFSYDDEQDDIIFDKTDQNTVHRKNKMDRSTKNPVNKQKLDRQRQIRREKRAKSRRLEYLDGEE